MLIGGGVGVLFGAFIISAAFFPAFEGFLFYFLHVGLAEVCVGAFLEYFEHGVGGALHPCFQFGVQRWKGGLVFGVGDEIVQAVGIVSHVVEFLGHAVFV